MSLLPRLLLCLTLLANLAVGAWAMPAGANDAGHAHAAPSPTAMVDCHEGSQAMAAHASAQGHAAMAAGHDNAVADPDCCRHAGCDCLQHCGATAALLPGTIALAVPKTREPARSPASLRGLPRPYQPVRPPIA